MADEITIDVPIHWIIGARETIDEPEFYDAEWTESSMKYLGLNPDKVDVEYRLYHEIFEVMVFKCKDTGDIVGGYLLIERDEYYAKSSGELDVMVAKALVRFGCCRVEF